MGIIIFACLDFSKFEKIGNFAFLGHNENHVRSVHCSQTFEKAIYKNICTARKCQYFTDKRDKRDTIMNLYLTMHMLADGKDH